MTTRLTLLSPVPQMAHYAVVKLAVQCPIRLK